MWSFKYCVLQLCAPLVEVNEGARVEQTLSLLMWGLHRGGPQEAVYWHKECLQKTSLPFICSAGYRGD